MNHGTPLSGLLCPYCSTRLDCADPVGPNRYTTPTAGAVSVCIECAEPAIFVNGPLGLAFRKPTADERRSIMAQIGPALTTFKFLRWTQGES